MKKAAKIIVFILLPILVYIGYVNYQKVVLISGFSAKSVISAYYISERSLKDIEKGENDLDLINLASNTIDVSTFSATASVYGLKERKAIYREGVGGVLVNDNYNINQHYLVPSRRIHNSQLAFPYGNKEQDKIIFDNINYNLLHKAVNHIFDKKGENTKRTNSVIVIYKDKIVAEKYANGFSKNSKILGWSMAKSLTATYFGILQKKFQFDIHKPLHFKEWQNDDRKKITTHHLLQMNSGLEWSEKYDKISDVTKMLFLEEDMTRSQLIKPLVHQPNNHWNYSSGTTNLLSGILRKQFKTHQEYLDFWYSSLIDKIGMHSMLVETDMKGNYIGSSYAWATTRDWAKLGLLYLHKGNWNGEQIFDKSWAEYVTNPTNTSKGQYGAQFWLNKGNSLPNAPKDLFYADGFLGQRIFIFPSNDLIIVRLGLKDIDFNNFLKEVLQSFK